MNTVLTDLKVSFRGGMGVEEWRLYLPERIELPGGEIHVLDLVTITNREEVPNRPKTTQIIIINGGVGPRYREVAVSLLGSRLYEALVSGDAHMTYDPEHKTDSYDSIDIDEQELQRLVRTIQGITGVG